MTTQIQIVVPDHIQAVEVLFEKRDHLGNWSPADNPLVVLGGEAIGTLIWDDKRIVSLREATLDEVAHKVPAGALTAARKRETKRAEVSKVPADVPGTELSKHVEPGSPVLTLQEVHDQDGDQDHGC